MVAKGDLIKFSNGEVAIATKGIYIHRYMDHKDYEMEACGMGEYAGSYTSVFDVVFPETGKVKRVICNKEKFTVLKGSQND